MEPSNDTPQDRERRHLSPFWFVVGAIAILVFGLLAISLVYKPSAPLAEGDMAPDFHLTAFDGTAMSLSAQLGHVTVINFFASWCAPCQDEAADIQQIWLDYQSRGVQFYGIGYKDAASKAQAFLDRNHLDYAATVEPGNLTARAYGITGVPETFLIDKTGRLIHHVPGPICEGCLMSKEQFEAEIDRLLAP